MSKNKRILTIENLFQPLNNNSQYMFIPNLTLFKNTSNVFLIIDQNTELLGESFREIVSGENNIKTLFQDNEQNDTIYLTNNKLINKKISFYNLKTLQVSEDDIPIVYEYQRIKENYEYIPETIERLSKLLTTHEYQLKQEILNIFKSKIDSIYSIISDLKREAKMVNNVLSQNSLKQNINEINNAMAAYVQNQTYYNGLIIGIFLDLFRSIFEAGEYMSSEYKNSDDFNLKIESEKAQRRLKVLLKMQKTNKETIKRELYLRDIKSQLNSVIQLKSFKKSNSIKTMKSLIKWYEKSIIIDRNKVNYFDDNSVQYRYLWKQIILKKYLIQLLKKNKKNLKYLNHENIKELKYNLTSRVSLFISNNLSSRNIDNKFNINTIKKIVKNEFWIDFGPYVETSYSNLELYQDEITFLRRKLKAVSQKKLNVFGVEDYKDKINIVKNNIDILKAEVDWKKYLMQSEFNQLVYKNNYINKKIKYIVAGYKSIIDYSAKINQKINRLNRKISKEQDDKLNIKAHFSNAKKSFSSLNSISFLFNYLELMRQFVFSKFNFNKKNLIKIDLFLKLFGILNSVSFANGSLTKTIDNIPSISRLKIGLLSRMMNESQILFIIDDENLKDQNLKNEFLRIVNEFAQKNGLTYVFITNDRDLAEFQNFDNLYVFYDNKLIEFGRRENLFNEPLHFVFKDWVENKNIHCDLEFNSNNYIFNECFKYDKNHYLIARNEIIRQLNIDNLYSNLNNIEHNTNETSIDELKSYSNTQETVIVDLNSINDVESSQVMTKEFNLLNETYENQLSNTVIIDDNIDAF
ncbi:hypothetical protein NXS15_03240 [Mycoplasma sp. CSL7475-4]|uniref:MAG1360 family OppF-related protein n=1 Tax=Mycoplasma sp. CSL7475-4 TaxID=2973942 RepID=UPI00216B44DD|nr:hypothetical protein [Mycoplasma sp. CSL7475-4]MCS4537126.1 hypothetical protein [Mycoplasma sp. CSL7475-4]